MKGPEKLKRCSIFSIAGRQNSREKKFTTFHTLLQPADEDSGRLLQETEYEGTGKIEAVLNFFYRWKTEQQRKKNHSVEREKEREGERRKSRVLSLVGV
jgi:hypothetical protein